MKIIVIGAGSVGMSIATLLCVNNEVSVLDIDENKVELINNKKNPINDSLIDKYLKKKKLNITATTDYSEALPNANYVIICLPTDYDENLKQLDTSIIENAIAFVKEYCNFRKTTIVIRSTVPIGFTSEMCLKYNTNNIIYSPDFSREGMSLHDNLYPSRIVIGGPTRKSKEFAKLLTNSIIDKNVNIMYISSSDAEAIKLFSNTYLALRISFFNELDTFAEQHNLNSKNIIEGICLDNRIGSFYNNPSFGYGGPCLTKDVKHVINSSNDIPNSLISSIHNSNNDRINYIAQRIKKTNAKTIGVYRTNIKCNVEDIRDSSVLRVLDILKDDNLKIIIYEPLLKEYTDGFNVTNDLEDFKNKSDIIIANRLDNNLTDVKEKVYTRDIFLRD